MVSLEYSEDFAGIKDSKSLKPIARDSSLQDMNLYSMFFYKDAEEDKEEDDDPEQENCIAIHFCKDSEGWYSFCWKSGSKIATNIQSQYVLYQAQAEAKAEAKAKAKAKRTELYKQMTIKRIPVEDGGCSYKRAINVVFREDKILFVSEWCEEFCRSSEGRYFGFVANWEDGDQREAPSLAVLDLKPLLQSELKSIRLPFRMFASLLNRARDELRFGGYVEESTSSSTSSSSGSSSTITKCSDRWEYLLLHVMVDNSLVRDNIISFL